MATIRNISDDDRYVPLLGKTVEADAVTDVPDDDVDSFTCQEAIWADESDADSDADAPARPRRVRKKTPPNTDTSSDNASKG